MADIGKLEVVPMDDVKLVEAVVQLCTTLSPNGGVTADFDGVLLVFQPDDTSAVSQYIGKDTYSLRRMYFQFRAENKTGYFYYQRRDEAADQIRIQADGRSAPDSSWLGIVTQAHAPFVPMRRAVSAKSIGIKQAETLLRNREAQVNKFQASIDSAATLFAEQMGETRREIDADIKARRDGIEAEYQEKVASLEQSIAERRAEADQIMEQTQARLDARAAELDEREKHLEALSYQDERRKAIKNLKTELTTLEGDFKLSDATSTKRTALNLFAGALVLFTGALFAYTSYNSVQVVGDAVTGPQLSWLIIKQITSLTAFAASSVFFIRWFQRWFDKHAEEEFRLKRLKLDLSRAGWLVETALDWKDQTKEELTPMLVERLSHGLFVAEDTAHEPLHPSDQLASALFGASSRVAFKTPGGEMELDRKGIKSLSKEQQ